MDPKDTAPAETATAPSTEPSATPQVTGSEVVEPANNEAPAEAQPQQVEESPEELRKRLEKLEMERNLLKNKAEKYEREQEEARKAELSEVERLKEELQEYEQKEQLAELEKFRSGVIEDYLKDNPAALKAAKALIEKNPGNLVWGEGADEESARSQLHAQLDALKEIVGPSSPEETTPSASINPNNPAPQDAPPVDRSALIAEAAKKGDFSEILKTIPSVQEQIARVQE